MCDVKNTMSFRLILSFPLNCKLSLRCFNKFIAFNFFDPAMLRVSFLCCKAFEIVKVASMQVSRHQSFLSDMLFTLYESFAWLKLFASLGLFTLARVASLLQL